MLCSVATTGLQTNESMKWNNHLLIYFCYFFFLLSPYFVLLTDFQWTSFDCFIL